ncbi:signal recognition particle-docking protein FtsY [Cronobacter dublinensis subsp. dublinensis]|uniref:signal recognition particle-docking protein FtsY n=1 Tax=Cronobacter dublinensis TaxID=413497 RepID=UPI0013762C8C|nr:signal recognition particle-docking protein FtsY [Cronobacter dublinensis]EGT5659146.1 signal recognition particle-docking protein FtsY [Cronobacter dublinensis subsp. dublinensis]EGT5669725.1 signal recognition particle-docking protein FtsY [Cronobacter dublinensis subsp. dublinensis]EGT5671613.1 signal recognition particle-docking protein FtsY [Cronobacter dublinensis subsp. dublinensis]EGT5675890.1 signal recognition particle-docking protein FtsY [Cronobacter dublinensis subsp. dublinensi
MAKEKKRGFFSWLGFGQKEQAETEAEQQKVTEQPAATEERVEPDAQTTAEETTHSLAESEKFAEDVVAVSESVVHEEQEKAGQPEPVAAPAQPETEQPQAVTPPVVEAEEWLPEQEETRAPVDIAPEPVAETVPETIVEDDVIEEAAVIDAPVVEEPVVEESNVEPAAPDVSHDEDEVAQDAPFSEEELAALAADPEAALETEPEAIEDAAPVAEQEKPTKEGFFARLKRSLLKTKENLGSGFISLFRGKKIDDDLFEELEEQLLIADVGVDTTRKIIANLTEGASRKQLRDAEALYGLLKEEMGEILAKVDEPLNVEGKTPFVILMVGVNGVGKTTTIGKLARQFEQQGKSVMLAAGDTFRAAAVEQLQVWGQRNNIPVIAQHTGADSASVIFDAIQAAKARGVDVLIADTAGRLQNKSHLMEELKKIVRVMKKLDENAPHEVMLTIDASTGQNAVSQAKLFHEAVGLTGITLTKLDGTAKGGVIFSVADQFGIPIRYIGVGERIEDLRPFNAGDFIEALFARED